LWWQTVPGFCFITAVFDPPGKNDLHIRVPAGFPVPGLGELWGENRVGLKAFGDPQERCISAVFWQTGCYNDSVSTRTGTDGFAGSPGTGPDTVSGNGARFGLIFVLLLNTPLFNIYDVN